MRTFRENIVLMMRDKGISQKAMAQKIGLQTQTGVSYLLTGKRAISRGLLESMCEALGITILDLASISSDLQLTATPEAVKAASLIDAMPPAKRDLAIALLMEMTDKK
jgi:transcriptional regulator with XRE-family HTH domain